MRPVAVDSGETDYRADVGVGWAATYEKISSSGHDAKIPILLVATPTFNALFPSTPYGVHLGGEASSELAQARDP